MPRINNGEYCRQCLFCQTLTTSPSPTEREKIIAQVISGLERQGVFNRLLLVGIAEMVCQYLDNHQNNVDADWLRVVIWMFLKDRPNYPTKTTLGAIGRALR